MCSSHMFPYARPYYIAADSSIELLAVANADADSFKPAPTSAAVTANLFVLLLSAFAY